MAAEETEIRSYLSHAKYRCSYIIDLVAIDTFPKHYMYVWKVMNERLLVQLMPSDLPPPDFDLDQ